LMDMRTARIRTLFRNSRSEAVGVLPANADPFGQE
jgi:hypothetical protein